MTIGEQQEWLRAPPGPPPREQADGAWGGASVLAALGATTAPWALTACARAASTPVGVIGRHLSFGSDPRRQMAIAAELTGKPVGPVVVDVGADATYGQTVEAEVRNLVSMVPQQDGSIRGAEQFFVHGFVDGLAPGARCTTGSASRTARRPRTRCSPPLPPGPRWRRSRSPRSPTRA